MRTPPPRLALAALFISLITQISPSVLADEPRAEEQAHVPERGANPDVDRARELDAFGAKAFREGRYRDAILFFSEAYRLGAPPIELWNLARCHERLEEIDAQVALLTRFVDSPDTEPADRGQARRLLDAIESRPSTLVVDPGARGGAVLVDGQPALAASTSPAVVVLSPGPHRVSVEREGGDVASLTVEARRGRALAVRPSDDDDDTLVLAGSSPLSPRRLSLGVDFGAYVPRLGAHTAPISPGASLSVRYSFLIKGCASAHAGLRVVWTEDRWASGSAPTPVLGTCIAQRDFVASDLAGFLTAGGALRLFRRVRAGAEVGFGLDGLVASQAGGELFDATCDPSFGLRPAVHAGIELSYAVAPVLRVVVSPALFDAHPAFGGARGDGTGLWLRVGSSLGVAVDL